MPRSRGIVAHHHRKLKTRKRAKGMSGASSKLHRVSKETVRRAMAYATRDRKQFKREIRGLWISRINAGVRQHGMSYSKFINALTKNNIQLNRKMLAYIAMNDAPAFEKIVSAVSA